LALGVHYQLFDLQNWLLQPLVLYGIIGVLSWLLNSEIPMFGMKIKTLDWRSNRIPLLLLVLAIPAFYFLHALALTAMVLLYILFSIVFKHEIYRRN
jgi:CDP-diacylglycerol--serine O-phosphatidyltransferase